MTKKMLYNNFNMSEKETKDFHITHSGELLIWLIIVLIFVSLSTIFNIHNEKNDLNDYQIFLQDVDGLIVGSPVRIMGIEVGYVKKIKPTNKEVYVKFAITNPDVYIPQGTAATVEFTGMAGSKSLELYPPNKDTYIDTSVPLITVNPPKRLHDALALLNEMYKKLNTIIYTTSDFGGKLNDIKPIKSSDTRSDFGEFIGFSNKFLEDSSEKAENIRNSLKLGVKNAK